MNLNKTFEDTRAVFQDGRLEVSNSCIQRSWKWTGKGLLSIGLATIKTGRQWTREQDTMDCDWLLPGYDHSLQASLTSLSARVHDDDGFTSKHLEVVAKMTYAEVHLDLSYTIWIYPATPGIRTQIRIRATGENAFMPGDALLHSHHRVDFLPIDFSGLGRRVFGYYNETQQRNDTCEDILKEATLNYPLRNREFHTWPSVLCLENACEGLAVVKESHKCPNQIGYDCGLFICATDNGLSNHGWGLMPREIDTTWRSAWASWCIVYSGSDRERQSAFKAFDAARYPLDPKRDIYVQANTWGSSVSGEDSRRAAIESAVLKELESCADLGIDVLQIDDGWQVPPGHHSWQPEPGNGWHPHPESYPGGWAKVRERAQELGIRLGLWAAAEPVLLEELQQNERAGGFLTWKLDFANLRDNESIRALMQKVRAFIVSTGHRVRVNWDVTEVSRRYGYFFAREFGCLYLANRKPVSPPSTTYRPHTMLRDLWQLSRYINLRKIQGSVQNIDRVNPQLSDANQHPHDYCVAITLMSTPLFFQQTVYYSEAARQQIRPLLRVYKEHRDALFRGTVYPIGARPDNYSWTGFQNHNADSDSGYLMLFRELNNDEPKVEIELLFVAGRELAWSNLINGSQRNVRCGKDGRVEFTCEQAPGFLFLQYK